MSNLDIATGIGFIANLSICPVDVKEDILKLYLKSNKGTINSSDVIQFIKKMRVGTWNTKDSNNDTAVLYSCLMMLGTQWCIMLEEKEAAVIRRKKLDGRNIKYKLRQHRKLKQETEPS